MSRLFCLRTQTRWRPSAWVAPCALAEFAATHTHTHKHVPLVVCSLPRCAAHGQLVSNSHGPWMNFTKGSQSADWELQGSTGTALQLEDFLCHGNLSKFQAKGSKSVCATHNKALEALTCPRETSAGLEVSADLGRGNVLSVAQFRIVYGICKSPTRALGPSYENDCAVSRAASCDSLPASRCSQKPAYQGVMCIDSALFARDRKWLTTTRIRMLGLREDVRKGVSQFLMTACDDDFREKSILLDASDKEDSGTALTKARHFEKMCLGLPQAYVSVTTRPLTCDVCLLLSLFQLYQCCPRWVLPTGAPSAAFVRLVLPTGALDAASRRGV